MKIKYNPSKQSKEALESLQHESKKLGDFNHLMPKTQETLKHLGAGKKYGDK